MNMKILGEYEDGKMRVGILSIPYALASGGWLSLILLFAIATCAFYSSLLIQRCMDTDPSITTYPDIGERAFGNKGRLTASIVMNIELYLVAAGFRILEGYNLHNLLSVGEFQLGRLTVGGKPGFIIIVALIILPTVWLDNLSLPSYVSASGVLASAIILFSIIWTGAFDGIWFKQKGKFINWDGIPTAVGLYAFYYCTHPVFPTLYTSMKKRNQFSNVLVVCFVLCTICYLSMAIFGYLMFGSDVQSQITLNLLTNSAQGLQYIPPCWSIFKYHGFSHSTIRLLLEDIGNLPEIQRRTGCCKPDHFDECCSGCIWVEGLSVNFQFIVVTIDTNSLTETDHGIDIRVYTATPPHENPTPTSSLPRLPSEPGRRRRVVAKGVQKNISKTSMLVNFLPTGTLLTIELVLPSVYRHGVCTHVTTMMIYSLLGLWAVSCFFFHFTDSFRGPDRTVYYGFVTPNGLVLFKPGLEVQVQGRTH
ncbi:Amino acid transporter isoform 2 [Hibiscus syriacus]|uniref:Amino acid transporter isoform 2 n=1 Tax=Hibiscus syriacus TaxID=106335 RepID=A0A6A3A656_HIBSY|nr:Amino acid transporter isoform 2 [Hibiscus syriacus]